jgi:hypothetical protein
MVFYDFNLDQFPVIILTIVGAPKTMDEMNAFLHRWQDLYTKSMQEDKKLKLLFDVRRGEAGVKEHVYFKRLAEWLHKVEPLTIKLLDKTVIIVMNDYIKFAFQVLFTWYKPTRPYKIFKVLLQNEASGSLRKAYDWLLSDDEHGDELETQLAVDAFKEENNIPNDSKDGDDNHLPTVYDLLS